jgi:hypothetical protein
VQICALCSLFLLRHYALRWVNKIPIKLLSPTSYYFLQPPALPSDLLLLSPTSLSYFRPIINFCDLSCFLQHPAICHLTFHRSAHSSSSCSATTRSFIPTVVTSLYGSLSPLFICPESYWLTVMKLWVLTATQFLFKTRHSIIDCRNNQFDFIKWRRAPRAQSEQRLARS